VRPTVADEDQRSRRILLLDLPAAEAEPDKIKMPRDVEVSWLARDVGGSGETAGWCIRIVGPIGT